LLQQKGAVSEEVAIAMARGVRHSFRSSVGVGITGIAGPTGATAQKPVGRVYIAISTANGESVKQYDFRGDRTAIRERAVLAALNQLRKILVF
jgi:nicotinamide-nucleotide amidase